MDHSNVSSFTAPADECDVGEGSPGLYWPQELKQGLNLKVNMVIEIQRAQNLYYFKIIMVLSQLQLIFI